MMSLQYSNHTLLEHEITHLKHIEEKYNVLHMHDVKEIGPNNVGELLTLLHPGEEPADDPIYIVDMGKIIKQVMLWRKHFPNVTPFYAVKCNNSPAIVETLAGMGCGFDCASRKEFETILAMGVSADRVIFANPSFQVPHLKVAREDGIQMMVVDSEAGLQKLKQHHPQAKIVLRIVTDDSKSVCRFSAKFGAPLECTSGLLKLALKLGLCVVGISFHVGSGCGDAQAFVKAVHASHSVWTEACRLGFSMQVLDIGGGFPGSDATPSFSDIAKAVNPVLKELFPSACIIAEPGRFFAAASHSLLATVISKRVVREHVDTSVDMADGPFNGHQEYQYYLNDGVYQSFNCMFFDHAKVFPYPIYNSALDHANRIHSTTIFGPTCDALDCIAKGIDFPEMEVGDSMFFPNMGAYTIAAASPFNGFFKWQYVYISTLDLDRQLCLVQAQQHAQGQLGVIKGNSARGRRHCGWKEPEEKVIKPNVPFVPILAEG